MLIWKRQVSLLCRSLKLCSIALLAVYAMSLSAQTLTIKLVDGRNGHPMVGDSAYVNVWVGKERKAAIAISTDGKGIARIQLTLNPGEVNVPISTGQSTIISDHPVVQYEESFRVNVPYVMCGAGEGDRSPFGLTDFSTNEVLEHGYVSRNTCGRVTETQQPGQVVLFVRPLTFLEKMRL